jgi:hypothetical protein
MKRNFLTLIALIIVANLLSFVLIPGTTQAQIEQDIKNQLKPVEDVYDPDSDVDESTFAKAIADIIKVVLGFLGIVFLILILYAGLMWITSAGNEEKISTAKKVMTAAVIGAAIVLSAYAITYFVIDQLLEATGVEDSGLD